MKHCLLLILTFFVAQNSFASFAEFFGPSPQTSSIGNLSTYDEEDPGNHILNPALLGWSKNAGLNLGANYLKHDFEPIKNIVVRNDTNSSSGEESEDVSTNYDDYQNSSVHLMLPIRTSFGGVLAVSYFAPIGDFIEIDTGDPETPEYVMYKSRYRRTQLFASYAKSLSDSFAFSLGVHVGFQTRADMYTKASLNGTNEGSSAATKAVVSPSLAALVGLAYQYKRNLFSFTYQQEMKSELEANVDGATSNPPILFDIHATALAFYDPHIFRLTYSKKFGAIGHEFHIGGEYQLWDNYQTPVIRISKRTGIESSNDYEQIQTKNIFIPKVGLRLRFSKYLAGSIGAAMRPSPLVGDFSGAGNSIDTNSLIFSGGLDFDFKVFDHKMSFATVAQYHKLEEKTVIKSANQEDGSTGNKIGAPGYTIGGNVITVGAGFKTSF